MALRPSAWLVAMLLLSGSTYAPRALAAYRTDSAGAACQPANGALSPKFTYNLQYLTNTGTADQTVVCFLPQEDAGLTPAPLVYLFVRAFLPTPGTTVTCLAQVGYFADTGNVVVVSVAQSFTSASPNQYSPLHWEGSTLPRDSVSTVLTLNCKLPPGGRIGTIYRAD